MVDTNTDANAYVVQADTKPVLTKKELLYNTIVIPKTSIPTATPIQNTNIINKELEVQQTVSTDDYLLATLVHLANSQNKDLYGAISNSTSGNLNILTFDDEWTRNTEKFNSKEFINKVSLADIYTKNEQIIYDEKTKEVSFRDPTIAQYDTGGCVINGSDTVTLGKLTSDIALIQLVDKINTFGKVYDFQFKSVNYGNYALSNTSICSSVANSLGYMSFDKLLNDEIVRKKKIDALYAADPTNNKPYSGFLVSDDYTKGGWINIDQLAVDENGIVDESNALSVRTRKLIDAKRILIKAILNFSSSVVELHSQNKLIDFGVRIKNTVTGQVFDMQDVKNGNLGCVGNQITLSYSGKIDYGSTETNNAPKLACDPCDKIIQDPCTKDIVKVTPCVEGESVEGTPHEIMPQIRINPLIGIRETSSEFVNTIDPITWTTGIQNIPNYKEVFKDLITEWGESEYLVGHLNVPRAFHYAGGDASKAFVCGGFFNSVLKEKVTSSWSNAFNNIHGWGLIGSNEVFYEIVTPGGYDYNSTNSMTLYYEEQWDGNYWYVKNNTVIPTPKAMGIAGGGKTNEEKLVGFGACEAEFLNNGVIKKLRPTSQVWTTIKDDVWVKLNNANFARISPAGYMKSTTINSSGNEQIVGLDCTTPPVVPNEFFYADSNASSLPSTELRIDAATQLKIEAAMKKLTNTESDSISTKVATNVGIVFNGWVGDGVNVLSTGIGNIDSGNINPFGLDKILDSELTNAFEYMQEAKVDFSSTAPSLTPAAPSLAASIQSTTGWFVDTTRNYPIKTMGTLYLGTECRGVATGGKTGVSTNEQDTNNTIINIKYSYYNDSKYSEFNNSIVNLVYEFNGVAWIRRENLPEAVAFHTGLGDANHQILFGGLHGSVERSDISVSYPGCDTWELMIQRFGGTWHRKGTTGLDREKRYASFSTVHEDAYGNRYFKAGDARDTNKDAVVYSSTFLNTGSTPDLSGVNWPSYVSNISGHITQITYAGKNSKLPNSLDITRFVGGESWVSDYTKYEKLNNGNKFLPYAEREPALDDIDQVGSITKNFITPNEITFTEGYKPDFFANPSSSVDGISSFPISGYFAAKNNSLNVVGKHQYAGHSTVGGMWLWSRPTAGEELFHPTNIHDKPLYYYDSCGIKHISGSWQSYESWIDQSFKTNIGLHSAVCWYQRNDCLTLQDSDADKALGHAVDTITSRNYRWTMGDFRIKANRLSPGGKEVGCLDINVESDVKLLMALNFNITPSGVCFVSGGNDETGMINPFITAYNSNFFATTSMLSGYPTYTINPSADFVGFAGRCGTPYDYFNRSWFLPTSPISGFGFDGINHFRTVNSCGYTSGISATCCLTCGVTADASASQYVFYDRNWFFTTSEVSTGCGMSDGFYPLEDGESCDNQCVTWWTSGCHVMHTPIYNKYGFYWMHNNTATYLSQGTGYYANTFSISNCEVNPCIYGKDPSLYWSFELPKTDNSTHLNNLRELYDTLSFGLPESYIKPAKFTYSFYITRDGVGLDQLFYGKNKSQFIERWKFPHRDTILDCLNFNDAKPFILSNDGNNEFTSLYDSNLFKYGTLCVGEFEYPKLRTSIQGTVDAGEYLDAIKYMSSVQADVSGSKIASYFSNGSISGMASPDFTSLHLWLEKPVVDGYADKQYTHYYPMSYDNFNGPITGGKYFLPRGKEHQSQFSIIPDANSSAIRDRATLWPWCDLLGGKSTNKPKVGTVTWYWDENGSIWTAEVLNRETITPNFCYDTRANNDPLHRRMSPTILKEWYPTTYDRETYRIKCQDKKGNLVVNYKIVYDEVAGPEIIGSKTGFDYNIFGTSLKSRSINLELYNNKPLNGPSQSWVKPGDEDSSIHAIDWRRTVVGGISGVHVDSYPYRHETLCEMISGGYNRNNIKDGIGYFCRIGDEKDVWFYSVPVGNTGLDAVNANFFIQESPFALQAVSECSQIGMQNINNGAYIQPTCYINGFPAISPVCVSGVSGVSGCCYVAGVSGSCASYDVSAAKYAYDSSVALLHLSVNVSGSPLVTCISSGLFSPNSIPLSAIGFFAPTEVAPSGYVPMYNVIGWYKNASVEGGYGSEFVRGIKYNNSTKFGGLVSSAYITGPRSFGIGGLGLGKSTALCGQLLFTGDKTPCKYDSDITEANRAIPADSLISKAWPWNIIGFDGTIGPAGFTDAIDDNGNYWIAIGDIHNTNPYRDTDFVSFENNNFKNFFTIVKVNASKKEEFFKTVLGRTNWDEVDGNNYNAVMCLSESFDLISEDIRGTRYREAILETLNMAEGQRYFDLYVKLIQENNGNIISDVVVADKVNFTTTETLSGSTFVLPTTPIDSDLNIKPIQILDIVSQFDINCMSCYIDDTMATVCPSASNWKQHNHEEWVAPYLESPFSGPYSEQGFNIWLTAGSEPRWGVALWSSIRDGKMWANYRRQRIHVNEYRNHVVLAMMTASVAIDDFEAISTSSYNLSGSIEHVPVYVNYDEFIYCLEDYQDAKLIKDILATQTASSTNGVDCTDHVVASINALAISVSGQSYNNITCVPISGSCNNIDISKLSNTNEGYVEWVSSFIQEYRSPETNPNYYFKYNTNSLMDSNTYMDGICINGNDIVGSQWRRYQDGVGFGGDAPGFNLYDNNTEFTCKRLNSWFIGQTAIGSPDKSITVGGYAAEGDGELHRSHAWWESTTFGITFKWNNGVIQPEDAMNINYRYRTLSPFWSTGENSGALSSMGVTIFDVSDSTKIERQGTAKFEGDSLEYKVLFDEVIPDYLPNKDKYCISLVCSDNVKAWWEDKSSTGFTIKIETSFTGYIDWSIYLEDTIPSEQIDNIDEQATFESFDSL